jgi:biofilm PGA synthesis protein PgaA
MQIARRSLVAVAILIAGLICTERGLAETVTQRREAVVLKARAGHLNDALAELRAMLAAGEDDGLVAMDLTALLQQARKSREAVSVFEKAARAEPPDYALLAATRAYRDLRRYDAAARLARQGLKRFADQTVWPLLLSLVLSDAQRPREALQILQQPEAQRAARIELLLAEGYAWSRAGNAEKAKAAYAEVLKLAPADSGAHAEASKALQDLGRRGTVAQQARAGAPPAPGEAADAALARAEKQLNALPSDQIQARRKLQREAAVLKARTGRMAEAQAELRALIAAGDPDGLAAMDLTALLQQDQKPDEAVRTFERSGLDNPPDYALLAATRAYRDLHRYEEAARLARQGLERFPKQTVWPLLLSLVLSDAGRSTEALAILDQPAARRASPVDRLLAKAYAWRRAGDPYKAIGIYLDALKLAPANKEARTDAAATLLAQGGAFGAAALAGTNAPFAADQAAAMVRWGKDTRPTDPLHRFDATDAAIARIDALLAALPPPPAEATMRRRLRLDRVVALRDRVRMAEAAEEGDALRVEAPLPSYAEEAYADALLYLRRPEEARDAYLRVLAQSPKDLPSRYGLFYSSVEAEDFATAYAAIDGLVEDEPVWRTYSGDPTRYANVDHSYAEVAAARARLFGNQLADAWTRITGITDVAVANADARLAGYEIANARGWPRRAAAEGEIAYSLDPLAVGAKIALIEIALAQYRFADAQHMTDELVAIYPEDQAVKRLVKEVDAQQRWLFEFEAKPADSSGGGANASGKSITLQSKLTTPPIDDNFRLFVAEDYANARPPEGYVQRARTSAGIEWRTQDWTATLAPSQSTGTLSKAGGAATLDWLPTDEWHLGFAGERFSWDTPLRALLHGITADEYATKAVYRWDESSKISANFAYLPFTDGNDRFTGGVTFTQKLIDIPHFDLDGRIETYASHNDRPAAPYYNPNHDLSATVGFRAEHVLWRRYDDSFVQALDVDGGLYSEAHFRDTWIGTVNYEHRWRFDPLSEFRYGVALSRRVYDGSVENSVTLTLGVTQRF